MRQLGLEPVEVFTGRLGVILRKLRKQQVRAQCAVINPMRRALGPKQLKDLAAFGLRTVVYLGPSPLGASRDARVLQAMGFSPVHAAGIDLHPGTAQVMMGVIFRATFSEGPAHL